MHQQGLSIKDILGLTSGGEISQGLSICAGWERTLAETVIEAFELGDRKGLPGAKGKWNHSPQAAQFPLGMDEIDHLNSFDDILRLPKLGHGLGQRIEFGGIFAVGQSSRGARYQHRESRFGRADLQAKRGRVRLQPSSLHVGGRIWAVGRLSHGLTHFATGS